MNDFTKEELKIILLEMNIVIHKIQKEGILAISSIYFDIRDKIQSMIDKYCNCLDSEDYTDTIIKCIKCGRFK